MSDKILRYSAEAIIIYLLLRYFPHKDSRLTTYQALIATFVLLVVSIVIELLMSMWLVKHEDKVKQETFLEKFDEAVKKTGCNDCGGNKKSNESVSIASDATGMSDSSKDLSQDSLISRYTTNDQFMRSRYGIDGMLYDDDDDDDKTNNLPMASDYEPSYSYISSESS